MKKPKAVKAWAILKTNGKLATSGFAGYVYCVTSRTSALVKGPSETVIPVLIVPRVEPTEDEVEAEMHRLLKIGDIRRIARSVLRRARGLPGGAK